MSANGLPQKLRWAWIGAFAISCGGIVHQEPEWPPRAKQWFERAQASYEALDSDDAQEAIDKALHIDPKRSEVRELAAAISLANLDYAKALAHAHGIDSPQAGGVRARAYWYLGKVDEAADELEELLRDPAIRDPWAEGILKLARQGRGRKPFSVKGELLAVMEMPRLHSPAMVVPVELNGQPVLAMLSTGTPEAVIDSSGGREPSWVTVRFDRRVEVKDVPALTQDLSGISRDLNAPIKMLIGTHLLRHLNATVDFLGRQFVVRTFEAPPPPVATKVALSYIRGGGMALRSKIGPDDEAPNFLFLVDTGSTFTVVLDEAAWKRTAVDLSLRQPVPGSSGLRQASLSRLQLGAFGIPNVPAISGVPIQELEQKLDMDLDGVVGSGLLSAFRVTWADGGRAFWLEDAPAPEALTAPEEAVPPAGAPTEQPAPPASGG